MILEDHQDWLGQFLIPAACSIDAVLQAFDDGTPWILDSRRQEIASQSARLKDLWARYPEGLKREQADIPTVEALLESIAAHLEGMGRTIQHNPGGKDGCAVCDGQLLRTPPSAHCLTCAISGIAVEQKFEPPWGESCPGCGGSEIYQAPERRFCLHCVGPILPAVRGLRWHFHTGMI